jgi:hypothetical protein
VNAQNHFGLREVEFVVTAIDEDAAGVEKRTHGSVAKDWTLLQPFQEVT